MGGTQVTTGDADPDEVGPSDDSRRELRIAPILAGGSSLAVWIGGVTAELYRVVNRPAERGDEDAVYAALLDLTHTTAVVDVITGTSAGGLNGVLLSTAWACDVPTSTVLDLRELWLELGSIDALLRSPNESDPPSLLRGDDYFWPQLTGVLDRIAATAEPVAPGVTRPAREVDLALTVTTLRGEPTHRVDAIGQVLQELRQDHLLRFSTADLDPATEGWSRRLGLAARTSASIPIVFESSYLAVDEPIGSRPAFGDRATFRRGRWAVDGGVLANQPIAAARHRIEERSARTDLRRVALFVNPTPPSYPPSTTEDPDEVPTIAQVASASAAAPHNIGIRNEVDQLRDHNERIRRTTDVRQALARIVTSSPGRPGGDGGSIAHLDEIARTLYPQFRTDRAVASVATMLDRVAPTLGDLAFDRRPIEEALVDAACDGTAWLPEQLPPTPADIVDPWSWGIAPLEYTVGMLLELIERAFRLRAVLHPDAVVAGESAATALGEARRQVHDMGTALGGIRQIDSRFWSTALARRPAMLGQWADACYAAWPDARLLPPVGDTPPPTGDWPTTSEVTDTLARLGLDLADLAAGTAGIVASILERDPGGPPSVEERIDRDAIAGLIGLLGAHHADAADAGTHLARLVLVHVIATALGDPARRLTPIDLIELSWNAPNALDPRPPAAKLAGVEFGRLGAFVKRSWRANDWMWGRMDGAAQLVRLLLDPRRLRQCGVTPDDVLDLLVRLDDGRDLPPSTARILRSELGFLDPAAASLVPAPRALPHTSAAFARLVQLDIARDELPHVVQAVERSVEEGAGEGDGGQFRRAYRDHTRTVRARDLDAGTVELLVRSCRIGEETAGGEVGEDLLTRTAGRTLVVAVNALTGTSSGLSWAERVLRPIRPVAKVTYAVTRAVTTSSRTGVAVSAVIFAVAGALIGMHLLATPVNPVVLFLALVIVLFGVFLAVVRSGVWSVLPALLALLVVALALVGAGVSEVVTTTSDPDAVAWKDRLFLGGWAVFTIVVWAGAVAWVVSLVDRVQTTRRRHRMAVRHAAESDPPRPRPAFPRRTLVEVSLTVVAIPVVIVFHVAVAEFVLQGDATGWRADLISVATWLGDRSLVVVLAGVVAASVFVGMGWDRTVGGVLVHRRRRRSQRGPSRSR
ncbi:MAG: patatin-like protein [Acidimicrobiales bacterium]